MGLGKKEGVVFLKGGGGGVDTPINTQSSHNSKFAMSLQYRKKQVRDEVDFLDADKHDSFLLVDLNTPCKSTQSINFAIPLYNF